MQALNTGNTLTDTFTVATVDGTTKVVSITINGTTDVVITPSITINDVSINEAAGVATFTVTLSSATSVPVSVNYATSNGTATAGSDYSAVNER